MRKAIFPGSFDPITIGHIDIINRALPLFDEIVLAIGVNSAKQYMFPLEQRMAWLKELFEDNTKVSVDNFSGLTASYAKEQEAKYLIRGIRSSADFEFEKPVAQMNRKLNLDLETVCLICSDEYASISSSIVREIHRNGGDVSDFVPSAVKL